jgi:hypothetical protein
MRRKLLALLIVPIVLVAFISCEGDIFGTISNFMEATSSNVLVEGGIATVDNSQVDAVGDSITGILALDESDPDYDAAFDAEVESTKEELAEVLESPAKIEALKTDLTSKTVAPEDIPTKVSDGIAEIETELGIDIEIENEADLLVATLIVSITDDPIIDKLKSGDDLTEEEEEQALALVDEAMQVVEVVKALSPTGTVELESAVADLLASFTGGEDRSRAISREGEDPPIDEILSDYVIPVLDPVLAAMDTNKNGTIETAELQIMIRDYGVMRRAYESMAPGLIRKVDGSIRNPKKLSDLINYALSVVFTSGKTLLDGAYTPNPLADNEFFLFIQALKEYVEAYDESADPTALFNEKFADFNLETIGTNLDTFTGDTTKWTKIKDTILNISRAIPKNTALTEMLEDAFADMAAE